MEIRTFDDADWPAVLSILREVITAGETYTYDPAWTDEELRAVWIRDAPGQTGVAVVDEAVVGTAIMGPNRPGPGSHVATASFMVPAASRGQGVGRALAINALQWAAEEGYAAMQFNAVVESNVAAVRAWESLGFAIIGTVPAAFERPSGERVGLHVMHRFL